MSFINDGPRQGVEDQQGRRMDYPGPQNVAGGGIIPAATRGPEAPSAPAPTPHLPSPSEVPGFGGRVNDPMAQLALSWQWGRDGVNSVHRQATSANVAIDYNKLQQHMTDAVKAGMDAFSKESPGTAPGSPSGSSKGRPRKSYTQSSTPRATRASGGGYSEGQYRHPGSMISAKRGLFDNLGQGVQELSNKLVPQVVDNSQDPNWSPDSGPRFTKRVKDNSGNYQSVQAAPEEFLASQKMGRVTGVAQGAIRGLGSAAQGLGGGEATEGALGGLGEIGGALGEAGGAASPIGAALAIPASAYEGLNIGSDILQQGRNYSAVYGGSPDSGLKTMLGGEVNKISNLFHGIPGGQSSAMYSAVTQQAFTGNQKTNALDTMRDLLQQSSVSAQQSAQAISIAATTGNRNLNDLADSITQVSEAAKTAGVNANTARDAFNKAYASVTATGATGGGATAVAGGTTSAITALGPAAQGTTSPLTTTSGQTLIAGLTGKLPAQIQSIISTNPAGAAGLENQAMDKLAAPFNPQIAGFLKSSGLMKTLKTPGVESNPALGYNDIETQLQQYGSTPQGAQFLQQLEAAGAVYGGTPIQNAARVLSQKTGLYNATGQIKSIQGKSQSGSIFGNTTRQAAATAKQEGVALDQNGNPVNTSVQQKQTHSWWQDVGNVVATGGLSLAGGGPFHGSAPTSQVLNTQAGKYAVQAAGGEGSPLQKWYAENVVGKGQQDPWLANIVRNGAYRNANYDVQTSTGQHTISASDLVKNYQHYKNQINSGQVTFAAGGPNAGQSLATAFQGMGLTPNQQAIMAAEKDEGNTKFVGKDVKTPAPKSGTGVTVTISPTPSLAKWLNITPTSSGQGVTVNNANAANVPPSPYPTPNAQPGATSQG